MRKTVVKMICRGEYRVIFDDSAKRNPYTIYYEWTELNQSGWNHKRTKKIEEYGDLPSCLCYLAAILKDKYSEQPGKTPLDPPDNPHTV